MLFGKIITVVNTLNSNLFTKKHIFNICLIFILQLGTGIDHSGIGRAANIDESG